MEKIIEYVDEAGVSTFVPEEGYYRTVNVFSINDEENGVTYPSRLYWNDGDGIWLDSVDAADAIDCGMMKPYPQSMETVTKAWDKIAYLSLRDLEIEFSSREIFSNGK